MGVLVVATETSFTLARRFAVQPAKDAGLSHDREALLAEYAREGPQSGPSRDRLGWFSGRDCCRQDLRLVLRLCHPLTLPRASFRQPRHDAIVAARIAPSRRACRPRCLGRWDRRAPPAPRRVCGAPARVPSSATHASSGSRCSSASTRAKPPFAPSSTPYCIVVSRSSLVAKRIVCVSFVRSPRSSNSSVCTWF